MSQELIFAYSIVTALICYTVLLYCICPLFVDIVFSGRNNQHQRIMLSTNIKAVNVSLESIILCIILQNTKMYDGYIIRQFVL